MSTDTQNPDTSVILRDDMAWDEEWNEERDECRDEKYIEEWDDWDLSYHLSPTWFMLKKREVLVFALGAIITTAMILRLHFVLSYPLSLYFNADAYPSKTESTAVFLLICLVTCLINLFMNANGVRSLTFTDGVLSAFAALGIYLFPQLTTFRPFLIAAIVLGIVLALIDYSIAYIKPSHLKSCWLAIINTAYVVVLIVNLASTGIIPMASATSSSSISDAEADQKLEELFDEPWLSDMSRQELADALQAAVHVECKRLGLQGQEPEVVIGLSGQALASYLPFYNRIILNTTTLSAETDMTGYDAIETVTHEMAHAYENAAVNGSISGVGDGPLGTVSAMDVERWRRELNNPVDPEKDFIGYWTQDTERRARAYSQQETSALLEIVQHPQGGVS